MKVRHLLEPSLLFISIQYYTGKSLHKCFISITQIHSNNEKHKLKGKLIQRVRI